MHLSNFDEMWAAYPHGEAAEVKARIGGKVDYDWIVNTCTIRVSRALHYSGHLVPKRSSRLSVVTGGDGKPYAFRVREFRAWLGRTYGRPDFSERYAVGEASPAAWAERRGVICFTVPGWSDATGHLDLWREDTPAHAEYFAKASKVELWSVPDAPSISASVGSRGRNRKGDSALVQHLLTAKGFEPGPVDGWCGRKTIAAIRRLQKGFLRRPDGRIDVGGRSWGVLTGE